MDVLTGYRMLTCTMGRSDGLFLYIHLLGICGVRGSDVVVVYRFLVGCILQSTYTRLLLFVLLLLVYVQHCK